MKNFQQFSLVSCSPAPFTSFLTMVTMFSTYIFNIDMRYTIPKPAENLTK